MELTTEEVGILQAALIKREKQIQEVLDYCKLVKSDKSKLTQQEELMIVFIESFLQEGVETINQNPHPGSGPRC